MADVLDARVTRNVAQGWNDSAIVSQPDDGRSVGLVIDVHIVSFAVKG
jgi:hypothetical protein